MDGVHRGLWGAVGVGLWIIIAYGLGIAHTMARGELRWTASVQTVCGLVAVVGCYVILGASVPMILDAQNAKEAVAEGLGWQALLRQFVEFGKAARP